MRVKSSVDELAIHGGAPTFDEPLHVGRPNIGDRRALFARLDAALDRRWLTNEGPLVEELEGRIAQLVGIDHVIALCNATVGLEVLARASGLEGEVIVPSFTFVATAHALQWLGIRPVFADIDSQTLTLDPQSVEQQVSPRTTGILAVHVYGRLCDAAGLQRVADRHGLKLFFDAAHALGCSEGGRNAGTFGDAEVFSFHATKFVNAFEGGALVTADADLAERVRLMSNFGFVDYDRTSSVGTNGKMSEAAAAMALTSLDAMPAVIAINKANMAAYAAGLADLAGVELIEPLPGGSSNDQYVVIKVDEEHAGLNRDALQQILVAENVLARRYFYPGAHRMEPYASLNPETDARLPVTNKIAAQVLAMPTGTAVTGQEIEAICGLIRLAIDSSGRLRGQQP